MGRFERKEDSEERFEANLGDLLSLFHFITLFGFNLTKKGQNFVLISPFILESSFIAEPWKKSS